MASYGFGFNNKGWDESKKIILAKVLEGIVEDMGGEGKFIGLTRGQRPYVIVDDPTLGVTIMNVSYLTNQFQNELIERANKKYQAITFGANEDSEGYIISNNN